MISETQVRAGRALLNWSQDDLAAATNLSNTTIRNIESGDMSARGVTMNLIRQIMENAGIEFTDCDGVKRRNEEIKTYQGRDSCDDFFNDMLQSIKENPSEVICTFKSKDAFMQVCAVMGGNSGRLEQFYGYTNVKCLLPASLEASLISESFQFRAILKQHIGAASYFVFGKKLAIVIAESRTNFKFLVFNSLSLANDFKDTFYALWDLAPPIYVELRDNDKRIGA